MSNLPVLLSPNGEAVELLTAQDLLRSRGIEDVQAAETTDLARFMDEVQNHVRSILSEAVETVSDELVARMDRRLTWTLKLGELKVETESPEVGSTDWDNDKLGTALDGLVEGGVIDTDGRKAVLDWFYPPAPAPKLKRSQRGLNALLKLPAAREAIEACRVETTPAPRKAKVTRS